MALKLDCTVCAVTLDADDLAIRRGIITCNYYSTILRITPKGTAVYQKEPEQRMLPANIVVKHNANGKTITTIKGVPNAMITKSSCLQGIGIGLGITAVVSLIAALFGYYLANNASIDLVKGLSPFCFHMFIILLGTSIVVAPMALGFRPPSLVIQNDVIIPVTGSPHLPKKKLTRNEQDTPDMNVKNMVNLFNNLRTAPAYSGEVDPEKIVAHSMGLAQHQIIARMRDGQDYWLIKSIDDPREAFYLVEKSKSVCQKI